MGHTAARIYRLGDDIVGETLEATHSGGENWEQRAHSRLFLGTGVLTPYLNPNYGYQPTP